jgi:hypothetical protein
MGRVGEFFGERVKIRLLIEGIMPERALIRLKNAEIGVYNAKKVKKNQILLSVKKKDLEKAFAIFSNPCYNSNGRKAYTLTKRGAVGAFRALETLKKRTGFLLGALLFCALTVFADGLVLGVRFKGSEIYAREAVAALEKNGIKPFSKYQSQNVDLICAELLSQKGVEYCSVKKEGLYAVVEVRLSPFLEHAPQKGAMTATHTGTLLSLVVLRGTACKQVGEPVALGETLVSDFFETQSGEKKRVEPIARASIACVYEAELAVQNEEEAFASAYLEIGRSKDVRLTGKRIEKRENGFFVRLEYTAIERMNF